jgi:hypothetical protein
MESPLPIITKQAVATQPTKPTPLTKRKKKMKKQKKASTKTLSPTEKKVAEVMHEFKEGELHSSSKDGPIVTNPKQAIAIALSEAEDLEDEKA